VRERGVTLLELVIALGVVVVLGGAATTGVQAHRVAVARAWSRLEASRAASSRLESIRGEVVPLEAGTTPFAPSMRGAEGRQRVREVAPGLHEVAVEVRHPDDGVHVTLTTLVAREARP
jgi:hypothetical protein